jgi:hypothetical protein
MPRTFRGDQRHTSHRVPSRRGKMAVIMADGRRSRGDRFCRISRGRQIIQLPPCPSAERHRWHRAGGTGDSAKPSWTAAIRSVLPKCRAISWFFSTNRNSQPSRNFLPSTTCRKDWVRCCRMGPASSSRSST